MQFVRQVLPLVLGRRGHHARQPSHPLPCGDVADSADHVSPPRSQIRGGQTDLDRNRGAVLAEGFEFQPPAHRTGARGLRVAPPVMPVQVTAGGRDQSFHRRALDLLAAPPEHRDGPPVEVPNHPVPVHDQHRVRRCLEHRRVVVLLEQIGLRSVAWINRNPVGTGGSRCRPALTHKMPAAGSCQGKPPDSTRRILQASRSGIARRSPEGHAHFGSGGRDRTASIPHEGS